ncbi:MAG: hypothetical protein L3J96_03600 [Thermoplasmata archaeon]|nr:hypothetical protein [Thermoplasmata archaeon]
MDWSILVSVYQFAKPTSLAELLIEVEATLFIPFLVRLWATPGAVRVIWKFIKKLVSDEQDTEEMEKLMP